MFIQYFMGLQGLKQKPFFSLQPVIKTYNMRLVRGQKEYADYIVTYKRSPKRKVTESPTPAVVTPVAEKVTPAEAIKEDEKEEEKETEAEGRSCYRFRAVIKVPSRAISSICRSHKWDGS